MSSIAFLTGENGPYSWTIRQDKPYTGGFTLSICYHGRQYVKRYYASFKAAKNGLKYYLRKEGVNV